MEPADDVSDESTCVSLSCQSAWDVRVLEEVLDFCERVGAEESRIPEANCDQSSANVT